MKGGTGHSRGILTAWENNGQKDEREKKRGGNIMNKKTQNSHACLWVHDERKSVILSKLLLYCTLSMEC